MILNFKKKKPFFEGVNFDDIIKCSSTPFYIYSQKVISENYKALKTALSSEIYYSVKANSNQAILKLLRNCGAGADVVSIGELKRSLAAGFLPNQIIYEGVGKSKKDIEFAIENNIHLINVESINEIKLIDKIGNNFNKKISIGIRLNPNINSQTLNKISTGKKTDKFGISINDLKGVIELIKSSNNINLKGISCHIGSQISEISVFEKIFLKMKNIADTILSAGFDLKNVDLGGGFAVNYLDDNNLDINYIGKILSLIFQNTPYKISFEPGRYLVAKAGILVTKILTIKENGGINFLIVDAGMQTLIRPALYNAFHRVGALSNLSNKKIIYNVAGPICESSDIIATKISLPQQNINNYLAIHDVGAYGAVMSSNYNSREFPNEILVNKKKFFTIHKGEKISKIIARDFIPKWL